MLYTTASMLLSALIFYLKYEAPEEEQNFAMVVEMLKAGTVKEDDLVLNMANYVEKVTGLKDIYSKVGENNEI